MEVSRLVRSLTEEEHFCLQGCRTYPQYHTMRDAFERDLCRFCHVDRKLHHVVYEDPYWRVWESPFPRKTLEVQIVIASTQHLRFLHELSQRAWGAMGSVMKQVGRSYPNFFNTGGNLHVRFGDMRYNAGTVPHLHWNYWVPTGAGEVNIPVIKHPHKDAEDAKRAKNFAKMYEAGERPG